MYQIVTYRSKPLKKKTIILEEDNTSSSLGKKKELTYLIDGVEVSEEDLTLDEKLDIESESLLNKDGFYTPLVPIDAFSEIQIEEKKKGVALKVGLIIGGALILLTGIVVAMIVFL